MWSGGPNCGGSTSSVASRSSGWPGDGVVAQHGAGGAAQRAAAGLSARAGAGRCWIRSRRRSIGCCAGSGAERGRAFASCLSRWAAGRARRSSTITCARCGRCSRRRRGRSAGGLAARGGLPVRRLAAARELPVGHGQTRRGYVVVACLGYSRAGAGVLVFSTRAEDLLAGVAGCLERWAACRSCCSGTARPASTATAVAERAFAAFCGQLRVGWRFCAPADPQAKGAVERLQATPRPTSSRAGASPTSSTSKPARRLVVRIDARTHKTLKVRPVDRLADERLATLPAAMPDTARRWTIRVPPDPYLRVDTNDYSIDPGLVGRRVEVIVDQREVTAVALDTGELACRHAGPSPATGPSPRSSTPAP